MDGSTPIADYPVPLVIGVVGHRDLMPNELPELSARVREFFLALREQFPGMPLQLLNPLAEGADRLVAREALALDIPLIVPLPMPKESYFEDFVEPDSFEEFAELSENAEVFQLPLLTDDCALVDRKLQYAQLGVFVSSHCHIMLALWDGKFSDQLGGTAQVVNFHQHDVMPGYADEPEKFRLIMADDESDLVYHICCSRTDDGSPEAPLQPYDVAWLTTSETQPRSAELPERYERIFRRAEEFNLNYAEFAPRIQTERYSLYEGHAESILPESVDQIDRLFGIADWLAVYYQKRFVFMLRAIHTLAVLMGIAFLAYSDAGQDKMIYAFVVCFVIGVGLFSIAQRAQWHRKYLDYRGLAEGMRVQFYWAIAGVRSDKATKFTHDNFLQKQEVELGWIRNVMRVGGLRSDTETNPGPEGLQVAINEWIGDDSAGQASYYGIKAQERANLHTLTEHLGRACLIGGVIAALVLTLIQTDDDSTLQSIMIILMGLLPLIAATRDAYAHKRAEKELIKQYRFMHQVFRNAARRLGEARTDRERREILRAVGESALDEHAEWILMHRERPLEVVKL